MLRSLVKYWLLDIKHSPFANKRGKGLLSLLQKFINLLTKEETAGNDNVFYNPQDLTSLRVGRDGSGGQPVVGDPVGMMLDTSGLSGSMDEFVASQPNLVDIATFIDSSVGTGTATESGGVLTINNPSSGNYGFAQYPFSAAIDDVFHISFTMTNSGGGDNYVTFGGGLQTLDGTSVSSNLSPGTYTYVLKATLTAPVFGFQIAGNFAPQSATLSGLEIKKISSGNHAIAPTDAARSVLMDDPDTTWASLTDDGTRTEVMPSDPSAWSLAAGHSFSGGTWVFSAAGGTSSYAHNGALDDLTGVLASDAELIDTGNLGSQTFPITYTYLSTAQTFDRGKQGTVYETTVTFFDPVDQGSWPSGRFQIFLYDGNLSVKTLNGLQCSANISVRKVNTAFDERGPELVTNGGFDTDASGWSRGSGSVDGTLVSSGGKAVHTQGATDATPRWVTTINGLTVGAWYEVSITENSVTGSGGSWVIWTSSSDGIGGYDDFARNETGSIVLQATATTMYLAFALVGGTAGSVQTVDGLSIKEAPYPNLLFSSATNVSRVTQDDDSTFDTDTGNWAKGTGWSIGSGVLSFSGTSNTNASFPNLFTDEKWYQIKFYVSAISNCDIHGYIGSGTTPDAAIIATTTGWHTGIARKVSGTLNNVYVSARNISGTGTATIDNVIVQELPTTTPTSYYLDTDGVDDWMEVTPTLNLGEQWWHTGAWQSDTSGDWPFTTSDVLYGGPRDNSSVWNWYNPSAALEAISSSDPATKHVLTIEQSDTNGVSGRYNGSVETDPITPFDDSANVQGLALFSAQNDVYDRGLDGRFYGGAWGQGQVDYDELTTLQDYLGTLVEPDIDPTDVTSYANVYEMLSAQTAAALFDIDDTTSLRVGRDGSGGVPVDGDPVGMMMDVSGAGGSTMATYLAGQPELVTNGTFDTDLTGWAIWAGDPARGSISYNNGRARISNDGTGNAFIETSVAFVEGRMYQVDFDVYEVSGSFTLGKSYVLDASSNIVVPLGTSITIVGNTASVVFTAPAGAAKIMFAVNGDAGVSPSGVWELDNVSIKELPGYVATAPSDAARPTLRTDNSPISSRDVLTTTFGWIITDGGRA